LLSGVSYARRVEPRPDRLPQGLPTPFHATASLVQRLEAAGYQRLDEREPWTTETNGRYYVTRNDSSIVAIKLGRHSPLHGGIRLVGAHTDSPCLRVKPQPELQRQGFWQLGVEVYGGALLAPGSTATCPWPAA
jgi:aspartyl aminopeptidase